MNGGEGTTSTHKYCSVAVMVTVVMVMVGAVTCDVGGVAACALLRETCAVPFGVPGRPSFLPGGVWSPHSGQGAAVAQALSRRTADPLARSSFPWSECALFCRGPAEKRAS